MPTCLSVCIARPRIGRLGRPLRLLKTGSMAAANRLGMTVTGDATQKGEEECDHFSTPPPPLSKCHPNLNEDGCARARASCGGGECSDCRLVMRQLHRQLCFNFNFQVLLYVNFNFIGTSPQPTTFRFKFTSAKHSEKQKQLRGWRFTLTVRH